MPKTSRKTKSSNKKDTDTKSGQQNTKIFSGKYLSKDHTPQPIIGDDSGSQTRLTIRGDKIQTIRKSDNMQSDWEIASLPQTPNIPTTNHSPQSTNQSPIVIAGHIDQSIPQPVPQPIPQSVLTQTPNPIKETTTTKEARKRVRKSVGGIQFGAAKKRRLGELSIHRIEPLSQEEEKDTPDDGLIPADKHRIVTQDQKRRNKYFEYKLSLLKAFEKLTVSFPEVCAILNLQNCTFSNAETYTSKILSTPRLRQRCSRIHHAIAMANEISIEYRRDLNIDILGTFHTEEENMSAYSLLQKEAEKTREENAKLLAEIAKMKAAKGSGGSGAGQLETASNQSLNGAENGSGGSQSVVGIGSGSRSRSSSTSPNGSASGVSGVDKVG